MLKRNKSIPLLQFNKEIDMIELLHKQNISGNIVYVFENCFMLFHRHIKFFIVALGFDNNN